MALGDNNSNRLSGINAPVRPASVDPLASQRTIYPLEAFVFDDPNRADNPRLRMKEPWRFLSNGMEVYAAGVDPEDINDGDRRLVVEGEVLKLQRYDETSGDWVENLALGGYDSEGNFTSYVIGSGITQNREDFSFISPGFAFPSPKYSEISSHFGNGVEKDILGSSEVTLYPDDTGGVAPLTWQGRDYFNGYFYPNGWDGNYSTYYFYNDGGSTSHRGTPIDIYFVINFVPQPESAGSYTRILSKSGFEYLYTDDTLATRTASVLHQLYLNVERATGEVQIDNFASVQKYLGDPTVSDDIQLDTTIYLTEGINYLKFSTVLTHAVLYDVATTRYYYRSFYQGTQVALRDSLGVLSTEEYDINDTAYAITTDTYPTTGGGASQWGTVEVSQLLPETCINRYGNTYGVQVLSFSGWGSLNYVFANNELYLAGSEDPDGSITSGWTHQDFVKMGMFIHNDFFNDHFSTATDLITLIDRDRDVALLPSANFGKTVSLGGGVFPSSYGTDNFTVVTGPLGPEGPEGPQGEDGPLGSNYDGGNASSIYQPDQIIDGGGASG